MCGIAGIIQKTRGSSLKSQIETMTNLISHRGPDAEGFYMNEELALGHRRLSILDTSTNGNQPMHYLDRYVITYNGEIYNYREIKKELQKKAYTFSSNTDTEVILAAYDAWGTDCLKRFNGMWGFAIYDRHQNNIFMSRDRFGIKPFYYKNTASQFLFGSEIKQLLDTKNLGNKNLILDYLILGYEEHSNETFFEGINKLAAGNFLMYDLNTHSFQIEPFYDLKSSIHQEQESETSAINRYASSFEKSVQLRLRSDVTVGSSLSGGLDSSAIVTKASRKYKIETTKDFQAFHIHYQGDQKFSEKKFVDQLAIDLPLKVHFIEVDDQIILENIDNTIKAQEEPFGGPSVVLQHILMKYVSTKNCPVLLDGQGGDETLLGYERYLAPIFWSIPLTQKIQFFKEVVKKSKLTNRQFFQYLLYFGIPFIRKGVSMMKAKRLFKQKHLSKWQSRGAKFLRGSRNITKHQINELMGPQLPHLLRYEDKNSMFYSIESRVPFLDHNNIETALSINPLVKVKGGWTKYILRKTMERKMDASLVWRRDKIGFELDEKRLFLSLEKEFKDLLSQSNIASILLKHTDFNKSFNTRVKWRLYNVMKWEKQFNVVLHNES